MTFMPGVMYTSAFLILSTESVQNQKGLKEGDSTEISRNSPKGNVGFGITVELLMFIKVIVTTCIKVMRGFFQITNSK